MLESGKLLIQTRYERGFMNNITVVVKAGVFKDETREIAIPEKSDVKAWIQESLRPIREELASCGGKISDSQRKQTELQDFISAIKDELNKLSQSTRTNIEATNKRLATIENNQAQWESCLQTLANYLSQNFIAQCREDVEKYFTRLSEETKALKEESQQIIEKQQSVSEQLALAVKIADFFCERYKLQLLNSEKELSHITQLAAALEKWNKQAPKIGK